MKRGFTLIEMLVAVAIIIILVSIALAVGVQVMSSSKRQLTVSELTALAGMEVTLQHKSGAVSANMAQFLQQWQSLHSALVGPVSGPKHWQVQPSSLQRLPNVKAGTIFAPRPPGAVPPYPTEAGVTAVLDGWGNPIVFRPTAIFHPLTGTYSYTLPAYFSSAGPDGKMGTTDDIVVKVP